MTARIIIPYLILIFFTSLLPQNNFTLRQSRLEYKASLENKIDSALTQFLESGESKDLDEAFWGAGLLLRKSDDLHSTLTNLFSEEKILPEAELRGALECAFTVYPSEFTELLSKKIRKVSHPKIFSMIAVYLSKNGVHLGEMLGITENYINRTGTEDHPIIQGLLLYLKKESPLSQTDVSVLLNHAYQQNIIFSLQYKDRNKPGFVLIKKNGTGFLRDSSGKTTLIPQMARALSNMPGFLTNGNTPQGIFTILGIDTSENVFIGNTPNLQLAVPFEVAPEVYFRTSSEKVTVMESDRYLSILPEKLRVKNAFLEAFISGKAGRNEIIAHGTATDINYYKNEVYFPYTPTLGCLCMREEWSEDTGVLVYSDQQKFMKLITENLITDGYFIVAEIDDSISADVIQKILK